MKAPPNVIATLIRRHFNGLRGPPVVGTPNATHEGIYYVDAMVRVHALERYFNLESSRLFSADLAIVQQPAVYR
jgi:hypothetical protein